MKFPYGIADFYKLITAGYFYADRTGHIPHIEDAGEQLLFLRPRRFGKSLLLSMLENYYDLRKADEFEKLFGHLAIGRNPTPKHNQYLIYNPTLALYFLDHFQRRYQRPSNMLEFKFVKPGNLALSGEQLRGMSRAELAALPLVAERLAEARTQTADYLRELRLRYPIELRMCVFAVVALGFERLVWEQIEEIPT